MKLTNYLLEKSENIWEKYYEHPFVLGIQEGNLQKGKFRHYIIQDYLYLEEYLKVFAIGVAKAKKNEIKNLFINYLNTINQAELEIHRTYMNKLDITKEDLNEKRELDNLSYTSYMLRIAYEKDELSILVAILSCALSYEKIAKNIIKNNNNAINNQLFCEWIAGYSSKEYSEGNKIIIKIIDELAKNCTKEEIEELSEIFINCSKYELDFWNFSWNYNDKK